MKDILVITGSDVLSIPTLTYLRQQNRLAGVAMPENVADHLMPLVKSIGIPVNEIHVLYKETLTNDLSTIITGHQITAIFVLTFPWLMPVKALNLLPDRFINFHFGLLPKYKGADPIFWQIRNAEPNCGVTVHFMNDEIDAGPVLLVEERPLMFGETYGFNARRLGGVASEASMKLLKQLDSNSLTPISISTHAGLFLKKPAPADLVINWRNQTANEIQHLINATNPRYHGAITNIRQMQVRLLEVSQTEINNPENTEIVPGTIVYADHLYGLIVACINHQYLQINVAYTQEGFFSGIKLMHLGFAAGEIFQ